MSQAKQLEDAFEAGLITASIVQEIPQWEREYSFSKKRRFRFDFAWPQFKLAVEIQGGIWVNGGHSRGSGLNKDYEKNFYALALGWRILYVSVNQIEDGTAMKWITFLLKNLTKQTGRKETIATRVKPEKPKKILRDSDESDEIHLP